MEKIPFRPVYGFTIIVVLLLILVGCNLPGSSPQNVDEIVALTLTAMSSQNAPPLIENTTPPLTSDTEIPTPMTPPINTPAPVVHLIIPGEMQAIESTIDDLLYNGDDFSRNLFERPFTQTVMDNRFDLDLQSITMSTDNTFFYFSLDLKDVNINSKTIDGNYGIELDIDKDGRGDYLLWAYQPPVSTAWDYAGISLFSDVNKDVGGARALISDPVNPLLNGYETEVWPGKPLTDADGAWKRISPNDATIVQLAVKRSLVGNPASFLWSAWSDDQVKATYQFDYNDFYSAAEAGSPYASNPNYPLKELAQMDSSCREAWGFQPTGNEPGICKKAVQATPKPTTKPGITPTKPKPGVTVTVPPSCSDVQVSAQVADWKTSYSGVWLCINGDCKTPDSSGYAVWYLPAGSYTITTSTTSYGPLVPQNATVNLNCGEKSLSIFSINIP